MSGLGRLGVQGGLQIAFVNGFARLAAVGDGAGVVEEDVLLRGGQRLDRRGRIGAQQRLLHPAAEHGEQQDQQGGGGADPERCIAAIVTGQRVQEDGLATRGGHSLAPGGHVGGG